MDNQNTHILVCDDELDVREMLQEYLAKRGYKVSTASGGAELRTVLSVNEVDAIIMDINMPQEDGLSILRSLHSSECSDVQIFQFGFPARLTS